nr:porin [Methyloceanibacter methanicus]
MFGGLTRTSSRIAIAAALGLGVYALSASPVSAQGYGGNCCADLEERVAELEATTASKGNKKVSLTISGWVIKAMNWWDDGDLSSFYVGDKSYDLGSRFAITGSATIAPGWSAGYNITVNTMGSQFGVAGTGAASNQVNENAGTFGSISTLYSYGYIKSDDYGAINIGQLSPASDNAAVLADISGTVIESNAVFFEGASFFLRPEGGRGTYTGLNAITWASFIQCSGLAAGAAGIGADCFGAANDAIRYDSPTFGGFRFETSYGKNDLTGPAFTTTPNAAFWDIALFYNNDWGDFKVSAAYSYTWQETAMATAVNPNTGNDSGSLHQVGATLMHAPSGLGIYGLYQHEQAGNIPDTNTWYLKPFVKRTWNPLGATIFYGEYGQYNDMYGSIWGVDQCATMGNVAGTRTGNFCGANAANTLFVTGSEVERWGLGVVQEIDAAAMHVFARWQNQGIDLDFAGVNSVNQRRNVNQSFEDWNLFQLGGIIFF